MNLILDATEALLADHDFENVSVQDIVGACKVSVGAFYARFPSKEALFQCLVERYLEERETTLAEVLTRTDLDDASLEERLESLVDIAIEFNGARAGLMRAFSLRRLRGLPLRVEPSGTDRPTVEQWIEFLLACRDEIDHPQPAQAVRFALVAMQATLNHMTLVRETDRMTSLRLSNQLLRKRLVRLMIGFLTA